MGGLTIGNQVAKGWGQIGGNHCAKILRAAGAPCRDVYASFADDAILRATGNFSEGGAGGRSFFI